MTKPGNYKWFSIRQKIILLILSITLLSVLTSLLIELFNNIRSSREDLIRTTTLEATLVSNYLIPTFLFDDPSGARDILEKLTSIPSIKYGAAYKPDGALYAEYVSSGMEGDVKTLAGFNTGILSDSRNYIKISQAVKSGDEVLGNVILLASTTLIREKTSEHIKVMLIVLIVSIFLAALLTLSFERIVSGPILRLADVTRYIQRTSDYSVRVRKEANDETGLLYEGFNDMLQSIEERIIERDIAQEKLQEERAYLEQRVLERTHELRLAKEKAEESDNLKSAFLANMSHEIRTPLNAILGCSSLIRETSPGKDELDEYYKMMEDSGKDLLKLIDDILDVSRIEANQVKVEFQDVSVHTMVQDIFNIFRQLLHSEKVIARITPVLLEVNTGKDFFLNTDPLRLKQIILNILNNSVKFTNSGSIELGYFTCNNDAELVFFVLDTGIGIAKEHMDKIFDRFSKFTDLKTKHYRGTGLGLSIALKLTQLLNGRIEVESELNVGTIFYLTFPIKKVQPLEIKADTMEIKNSLDFLSGKVILIAEDVENNFRYMEIVLGRNPDTTILHANDGREAVEMFNASPVVDIVLMDIQLPEIDGIEATKIIKSSGRNIPVIAVTAYATSKDEPAVIEAGFDAYLIKPVDMNTLLSTVAKLLNS
jgi:signal transduction histidine kinase/CheY-like chemotaxis protein